MKLTIKILLLFICMMQLSYCQEDGVATLDLPVRNSLTFNRYTIHPTFSFVREQHKYISIYNKREWVQFEDAPLTYLGSFTGRLAENMGGGIGLFQQNFGVLTSFGGILNFAYNVQVTRESNLTFGMNLAAFRTGVNDGSVIINSDDPSLQNVPETFMMTINPGINYGLAFIDIGLSVNNLVAYNFQTSEMVKDDPQRSIQGHLMYTGYMDSRGFFDQSKFSGLIRAQLGKEETIVSAIAMLTVPKGIWAQAGYNSVYGFSGGMGLNITEEVAIEYNFEKAIGELNDYGPSHDITLAYRFKNRDKYYYSGGDEVSGLISTEKKIKPLSKEAKAKAEANRKLAEERKALAQLEKQPKKEEEPLAVEETVSQKEVENPVEPVVEEKPIEEVPQPKPEIDKPQVEVPSESKQGSEQDTESTQEQNEEFVPDTSNKVNKAMLEIQEEAEGSKSKQDELLEKIDAIVQIKDKDLKDLKEENDLSDQGIVVQPKPFKSVTEENQRLQALKTELEATIKERNEKIEELKEMYEDNFEVETIMLDEVVLYYKNTLKRLQAEQIAATEMLLELELRLEEIAIATEFEKNRRIKRAAFDNEEDRYTNDRAMLQNIKESTAYRDQPYAEEDFDFGEERNGNIQILQNVNRVDSGYYLILAVHSDTEKRNEFLTKAVESGQNDIDFFYDVSSSKYYIYYSKFDSIEQATEAMKSKGNKPYNTKMSLVKIEN